MRTRRDHDPDSSGERRSGQPEAVVVVPVVWDVPVAVGRAEVLWIVVPGTTAEDTATRGRSGLQGLHGWIEPATPEDRVAQAPRLHVLGMRAPGAHGWGQTRTGLTPTIRLIREAMASAGSSPYVLPSQLDPKAHMLVTAPTKAMGRTVTALGFAEPTWPHDLRRTVSTNLARLKVSREDAERVLNHVQGAKAPPSAISKLQAGNRRCRCAAPSDQLLGACDGDAT